MKVKAAAGCSTTEASISHRLIMVRVKGGFVVSRDESDSCCRL